MEGLRYISKKQKQKADSEVQALVKQQDSHKKIQEENVKAINKQNEERKRKTEEQEQKNKDDAYQQMIAAMQERNTLKVDA